MEITLKRAGLDDAQLIHTMQIESFMPLLKKYRDYDTSPGNEPLEKVVARINQPFTDYYIIQDGDTAVGAIRISKMDGNRYRIAPIFVLTKYQGQGIGQKVFQLIEQIYNDAKSWELDTILQEQGNCYLYEKLGYKQTGKTEAVNENMTLVFYEKQV